MTHLLKLVDKMCKCEIDSDIIVEDTKRTQFCPQMDRWTDGQGETSIPPPPPLPPTPFWSWLIRCANVKQIRMLLWKIQTDTILSTDGQMDRRTRWNQYTPHLVCSTSLMASLIRSFGGLSKYFYQCLWLADLIADVVGQSINRRWVA